MSEIQVQEREMIPLKDLKPHPRNYRNHPTNQIEHLMHSIREFGFYRNIVIARENTILAGHGIAEAGRRLEIVDVPVVRLDIDPFHPLALKLLAADNYLPYFAEDDDRLLTEMLKELAESDYGLLGTGFDEAQLALLTMVTRPASEIADFDAAAEWVGMPDFDSADPTLALVIRCETEADRQNLIETLGVPISKKTHDTWSAKWPPQERDDTRALLIEG